MYPVTTPLKQSPSHADVRRFGAVVAGLALAFAWPLAQLARFAWHSSLYSHILLIPFVAAALGWMRRNELGGSAQDSHRKLSLVPTSVVLVLLLGFLFTRGWQWPGVDRLSATTALFVLSVFAASLALLSPSSLRALAFPIGFLVFMVPFPNAVTEGLEHFLQYGSAAVARVLFSLRETPHLYQDLVFELPGITLQVAPECSGIHSTLVLIITSVVAAYLVLGSWSRRVLLILFIIPLALLRNGFRVFVIGELCVRVDPEMIHSWVHRRGGPLFFLLSLIPFFLLLVLLARSERRTQATPTRPLPAPAPHGAL